MNGMDELSTSEGKAKNKKVLITEMVDLCEVVICNKDSFYFYIAKFK